MKNKLNIIFDFDSTLAKIEGIDELAKMKNKSIEVEKLTNSAMNGEVLFEDVFEKRLEIIKPNISDINKLANLYEKNLTPGSAELVSKVSLFCNVFIVSGGYKESLIKSAGKLKILSENVFGNELTFDQNGNYLSFNKNIPLWKTKGKIDVINIIKEKFDYPTVLIGDGYSDLECEESVEMFICFTGVVKRGGVLKKAEKTAEDFDEVYKIIRDTYPQFSSHL